MWQCSTVGTTTCSPNKPKVEPPFKTYSNTRQHAFGKTPSGSIKITHVRFRAALGGLPPVHPKVPVLGRPSSSPSKTCSWLRPCSWAPGKCEWRRSVTLSISTSNYFDFFQHCRRKTKCESGEGIKKSKHNKKKQRHKNTLQLQNITQGQEKQEKNTTKRIEKTIQKHGHQQEQTWVTVKDPRRSTKQEQWSPVPLRARGKRSILQVYVAGALHLPSKQIVQPWNVDRKTILVLPAKSSTL